MRGACPRDYGNQWYGGAGVHAWKISLPVPGSRQRVAAALYLARSENFVTKVAGYRSALKEGRSQGRTDIPYRDVMFNFRERVQHGV